MVLHHRIGADCLHSYKAAVHLVGFADGEALPQLVLRVQVRQQLAVHPVLDGVHHLRLRQHRPSLLLQPRGQHLRLERDLRQRVQHLYDFEQRSVLQSDAQELNQYISCCEDEEGTLSLMINHMRGLGMKTVPKSLCAALLGAIAAVAVNQ